MGNIIRIGKIKKKFIIVSLCSIGYALYNAIDEKIKMKFSSANIVFKYRSVETILNSFGFALALIPFLISIKLNKSENNSQNQYNANKGKKELIFNPAVNKLRSKLKKRYFFLNMILTFIDWIFVTFQSAYILSKGINSNIIYNPFFIVFLTIFSKRLLTVEIYKHQWISLIILNICGILYYILMNIEFTKDTYDIIPLLLYLPRAISCSVYMIYWNKIMDIYYISPYFIMITYSIGTFLFNIITVLISSYIQCTSPFCMVEDDKEKGKFYFLNIFVFFNELRNSDKKALEFLYIFSYIIIYFFYVVLEILVIKYFSTFYICIIFYFRDVVGLIKLMITKEITNKYNIIFISILLALILFFILVFLEFLEIKFCGLIKNTRREIEKRNKEEKIILETVTYNNEGVELCDSSYGMTPTTLYNIEIL